MAMCMTTVESYDSFTRRLALVCGRIYDKMDQPKRVANKLKSGACDDQFEDLQVCSTLVVLMCIWSSCVRLMAAE